MKTITYDETLWQLVPVEPTNDMLRAAAEYDHDLEPWLVRDLWHLLLDTAPRPPVVNQSLTTDPPASVAPPALYQHDDGRYALALGDVARHRLTDGEPAWHRVPLDVVVGSQYSQEEHR